MNWFLENYATVIVVIILVILVIASIISIRKSKGKCAYCSMNSNCPFANKKVE